VLPKIQIRTRSASRRIDHSIEPPLRQPSPPPLPLSRLRQRRQPRRRESISPPKLTSPPSPLALRSQPHDLRSPKRSPGDDRFPPRKEHRHGPLTLNRRRKARGKPKAGSCRQACEGHHPPTCDYEGRGKGHQRRKPIGVPLTHDIRSTNLDTAL
jgi:hypothetical protein